MGGVLNVGDQSNNHRHRSMPGCYIFGVASALGTRGARFENVASWLPGRARGKSANRYPPVGDCVRPFISSESVR